MVPFWLQFAVVLGALFVGARISGVGIGLAGGLGLVLLVFVFKLQPSSPPIDVMLIIMAVITMVATLHAAGGLDYLVGIAEWILRKDPNRITIVAPLVTYFFTVFCGTAYVAFAIYPIIVEVAMEAKVRPERPMSIALCAASQEVVASPMSAATAVLLSMVSVHGISMGRILLVIVPAGLAGVVAGIAAVYRRGAELEDDPEFLRRLAAGEIKPREKTATREVTPRARLSVLLFAAAVLTVVVTGAFPQLLPTWTVGGKVTRLSIPHVLEMTMLSFAFVTTVLFRVKPSQIVNNTIFVTGMMAVVAIFGIAWMTDTFFNAHTALLVSTFGGLIQHYPYLFAIALVLMAALLLSQGAAMRAIGPLGMKLGVTAPHMVGMFPAAAPAYFIPGTGSVIGAAAFDRTGTTKIGKWVLNHSFMRPGVVTVTTSTIVGYLLALLVF